MATTRPWEGIDKKAFCENAILLDLKFRAQGDIIRAAKDAMTEEVDDDYPFPVQDLLDDIALVAAASGGKDNVTAACLERGSLWHRDRTLVIRIARNAGTPPQIINDMQEFLDDVTRAVSAEAQVKDMRKHCLSKVMHRCYTRLKKHAACLARLSNTLQWSRVKKLPKLPFEALGQHYESQEDIQLLGPYSAATHDAFVEKQRDRLENIAVGLAIISKHHTSMRDTGELMHLVELAYLVRKSSSSRAIITQSISLLPVSAINVPTVNEVVQRLGQLSKFARAAHHLSWHLERMKGLGIRVKVEGTPSVAISIPELSNLTPKNLRNRGGARYRQISDQTFQTKIRRWPLYREHAEIQLIMFYEERPEKTLISTYIGCNKLSCFLCYNFISHHGRFHTGGCHQSLYSLWTVRDELPAVEIATGKRINQALRKVSDILEDMVVAQRRKEWRGLRIGPGPESIANLSRISLPRSGSRPPQAAETQEEEKQQAQSSVLLSETLCNTVVTGSMPVVTLVPFENIDEEASPLSDMVDSSSNIINDNISDNANAQSVLTWQMHSRTGTSIDAPSPALSQSSERNNTSARPIFELATEKRPSKEVTTTRNVKSKQRKKTSSRDNRRQGRDTHRKHSMRTILEVLLNILFGRRLMERTRNSGRKHSRK